MDRKEFDRLTIERQINHINDMLACGETLTNICKSIGIGRTTIRDRFKKVSYEYNDKKKQYETIVDIVEDNNSISTIGIREKMKEHIISSKKHKSSNLVVETDVVNNKLLEDLILNYDKLNKKLDEVYSWYQNSSNNAVIEEKKLIVEPFEGELVSRSFKLYEPIQREFADFCKANNRYKVQDILCLFIKDGLEKYR